MRFIVFLLLGVLSANSCIGEDSLVSAKPIKNAAGTLSYCRHDGSCDEPVRNICTFDKNKVPWVEQHVPNLRKSVDGATLYHLKEHYGAVVNYELPSDFFWKALGLEDLFEKPDSCCGSCNQCAKPIEFTKFSVGSSGSKFTWITGDGKGETTIVSKSSIGSVRVSVTYKNTTKGEAVIWADGAEYFFNDAQEPEVQYEVLDPKTNNWKKWFSGSVYCFAPARDVTVIQHHEGASVPNINMLFIDDSPSP